MIDSLPKAKAVVVQAAPVLYHRDASLEKAIALVADAAYPEISVCYNPGLNRRVTSG